MMQSDLIGLAEKAQSAWGQDSVAPRLISHRENAVFKIRMPSGQPAALRLHRPGYCSEAEILSELWWTQALAKRQFPAPGPIADKTGNLLLTLPDGQMVTVISWVNGAPVGVSGQPLAGDLNDRQTVFHRIGGLLAQLHLLSDQLTPPSHFTRRHWDLPGLLGEAPHWGRFWDNPALDPDQRDLVALARDNATRDLADYVAVGGDYGLIHADTLRENVFADGRDLTLIDFDDAGYGFRMYELAVAVSQSLGEGDYADLQAAILSGYCEVRPLKAQDIALFPMFAMLRSFASLGWVMPRLPADHPGIPRYIDRAIIAARAYLAA